MYKKVEMLSVNNEVEIYLSELILIIVNFTITFIKPIIRRTIQIISLINLYLNNKLQCLKLFLF